jgi:hypothetical protein
MFAPASGSSKHQAGLVDLCARALLTSAGSTGDEKRTHFDIVADLR